MPRHIIPRSKAGDTPNEGPAVAAAVAVGVLRVAQREVSRVLHAAVLSRNRIRATKRIQAVFCRVKESQSSRHATYASASASNHTAPTNEPHVNPPTILPLL